jgi:hypothetical protein
LVDPLLGGFFQNDLSALSEFERRIVLTVHTLGSADEASLGAALGEARQLQQPLSELGSLGYLRRDGSGWAIGNRFLANWLTAEQTKAEQAAGAAGVSPATDAGRGSRAGERALIAQLNDRRSRLIELEVIRARDLLETSPQVLAEIRQTEDEIRGLRSALNKESV